MRGATPVGEPHELAAAKLFAALDAEIPPGPPDPAAVARVAQKHGARLG